jgi:hypothetical protein
MFIKENTEFLLFLKPGVSFPLTAALVKVESAKHEGVVTSIDPGSRTLTVSLAGSATETVLVEPGATILNSQGAGQTLVSFGDIKVGDSIAYFGLVDCTDTRFHAFVVVIGD